MYNLFCRNPGLTKFMGRNCYGPKLTWAEIDMGRFCYGPKWPGTFQANEKGYHALTKVHMAYRRILYWAVYKWDAYVNFLSKLYG